jgi:galactose oxidase-like protein/Calx-beta domain-containing protein
VRLPLGWALAGVLLGPATGHAATILDCDRPGTPFTASQLLDPPPPRCLIGGPTGSFLRLADTTFVNRNSVAFDLSDPGPHGLIVADFDFRLRPQAVDSRADGFGFTLVPTAGFGTSGFVGGGSEEPNLKGSLGIGFDIHQGPDDASLNHVSVHWDSAEVAEVDVSEALDLANGHFNHARIVVRAALLPPDVTITLTPCGGTPVTVVDRFPVPGLLPYESRVQLMGRSGGFAALHDLDNVNVQFADLSQCVVSLARRRQSATEADADAVVTVERVGNVQTAAAVRVSTADGVASAGADYRATSVVATFGPGETERTVTVPLVDDAGFEGDETFVVRLTDPAGTAAVGGPDEALVTIVDDEAGRARGHWSDPVCLPVVAIHAALLPQGAVMFWPREAHAMEMGGDQSFRWDPVSGVIRPLAMAGFDIFCSGHTWAADGRLFVAGGHDGDDYGLANAAFYDPVADAWELLPDMNAGRWYPSTTLLPNGDLLAIGGSITPELMNDLPQVWDVRANGWRDLTGARLGEPDLGRYYPWMHVVGEGRVFCAGRRPSCLELDPRGAGAWTEAANSAYGERAYGSSAMYSPGRILITGGMPPDNMPPTIPATATTEVIDANQPSPAWRFVAPMALPRRHVNLTLLPDGGVLATGGTGGPGFNNPIPPALAAERWDPVGETWATLAEMTVPGLYHSVALLLPDGRVMCAGGGQPSPPGYLHRKEAEIFSPPYLFRGPRPRITAAPASVRYGETFLVETPGGATVDLVRLIGLSSVTHAFNAGQRVVPLDPVVAAGGVWVTAPLDSALCPPGPYLLFLVTADGVPSEARVVRVSGPPRTDVAPSRGTSLAIHGTLPQPGAGALRVWLTLATPEPATLALFDVTGRAIGSEEVGHLGVGSHVVTPRKVPVRSGIYLARLTQNGRSVACRIAVLR